MSVILEIIFDILTSIVGSAVDEWYYRQSWWVKAIVVSTVVFVVLMILYFLVFLPFFGSPRGSN